MLKLLVSKILSLQNDKFYLFGLQYRNMVLYFYIGFLVFTGKQM